VPQPPGSCAGDEACPAGYACVGGECRAGACATRADCPGGGECVLEGEPGAGTCLCHGCAGLVCPIACRRSLLLGGCVCRSESDCPPEDDVCFLGICS